MKPTLFWTWVTAVLFCGLAAPPVLAQDDAGAGTGGTEADATPPEAASDAKRMVRIRQVIELDSQHLRWLRSELRSRDDWFERLAAGMAEIAKERNEKKEKLEALDADPESDEEEAEALRAELKELDVDYGLFDTQTDLALTGERAVREQIGALEEKLAIEKRALGELTGEIEIELPEPSAPAPTPEPAKAGKAPPIPSLVPIPATTPERKGGQALLLHDRGATPGGQRACRGRAGSPDRKGRAL